MTHTPTVRCGSDERTHDQVRVRAARLATGLGTLGLTHGDRYAIVMRNEIAILEATMAGAAIGAVPVPVNWHWTGEDLAYLLQDSGSKLAFVHTDLLPAVEAELPEGMTIVEVAVPDDVATAYGQSPSALTGRYRDLEAVIAENDPLTDPVTEPALGVIYTSGTTGRPKGILRQPVSPEDSARLGAAMIETMAMTPGTRTLVPAPIYHTAPNAHAVFAIALGMDLEIMAKFDAEALLALIEERRIEHIQMVPTMFVRLLKLPADVRTRYDLSSLKAVVHAAALCPPEVKRAMIDWLGPIVHEYYGGSETGACVTCTSEEWLAHPGTVGRPAGDADVRILDPLGHPVATGEVGDIYIKPFGCWPDFTYMGNDAKRLDADGFLYLSDWRNDMVISGGVNIYPAEIESCLIGLEGVDDVAVFGIPDAEFGESLAAHVQLAPGACIDADDIRAHVAARLAKYKVPKVVVFEAQLPRHDTGKLFKRRLKEQYWPQPTAV